MPGSSPGTTKMCDALRSSTSVTAAAASTTGASRTPHTGSPARRRPGRARSARPTAPPDSPHAAARRSSRRPNCRHSRTTRRARRARKQAAERVKHHLPWCRPRLVVGHGITRFAKPRAAWRFISRWKEPLLRERHASARGGRAKISGQIYCAAAGRPPFQAGRTSFWPSFTKSITPPPSFMSIISISSVKSAYLIKAPRLLFAAICSGIL